jgi:predicted metal-dependent phosphoesterase TrpH
VGRALASAGLDGVECLSRNSSPKNRAAARAYAEDHNLGRCGGSDLHFETPRARVGTFGVDEDLIDPRLMDLERAP